MRELILIVVFLALEATALRFSHTPVTVDTDVLIVNRPARLTCNYVKFRTESVRKISWKLAYGSVSMPIFSYAVTKGTKQGSMYGFVETDEESATDSQLTMTLTDFRDANMTLSCEVEVSRDNGYGKMRHSKKLGSSFITVIDNNNHKLVINPDPEQGHSAEPGKDLTFSCMSKGANPVPKLTMLVAGQNVSEMSRTQVRLMPATHSYDSALGARIEDLPDSLFRDGYLTIECLAHYEDFLFEKKELALERATPVSKYGSNRRNDDYEDHSRPNQFTNDYKPTTGRYNDDEDHHQHDRGFSSRMGRLENDADAETVHSRILDMIDPARHVHPGVPYDFFAGYLLLVGDSLNTHAEASSTLWGELPYVVQKELERNYGRIHTIGGGGKARVDMDPIKVLNALGQVGYRVIAASATKEGGYVWTLERRNFDIQKRQEEESQQGYRRQY